MSTHSPVIHAPRIRRRARETARRAARQAARGVARASRSSDAITRPRIRRSGREAPALPVAVLLGAAAGGVALLVASGIADSSPVRVAPIDQRVRRLLGARFRDRVPADAWWLPFPETRRHAVAEAAGGLAGDWTVLGAGALAAVAVALRRGPLAALPVLAAPQAANSAHGAVKYVVRRPRPVTARLTGKQTPSFPSGHAARGAATAGLLAYLAAREGVLGPRTSAALGTVIALAGGGGRVYVDRHWSTDALGGWGLGTTIAALAALGYDAARRARE